MSRSSKDAAVLWRTRKVARRRRVELRARPCAGPRGSRRAPASPSAWCAPRGAPPQELEASRWRKPRPSDALSARRVCRGGGGGCFCVGDRRGGGSLSPSCSSPSQLHPPQAGTLGRSARKPKGYAHSVHLFERTLTALPHHDSHSLWIGSNQTLLHHWMSRLWA